MVISDLMAHEDAGRKDGLMSKRAQLVCQHLENISREALERHQEIIRQYVRGRQGVYALYRRNKLYYVGLATNLRNRLKHHLKDQHGLSWDRFSVYLTIGDHHLRELEALILRTVKPSGNKQKGKFVKSEDLRRRFRRDIKRSVMAEVEDLFCDGRSNQRHPESKKIRTQKGKAILADYVSGSLKLRAWYKDRTFRALLKKNGMVRYASKEYKSPSLAGCAVIKHACNGWHFWHYERAPGDWVALDNLRR